MTKRISTLALCLFALAGCDPDPLALGMGEFPEDPLTGSGTVVEPDACESYCQDYRNACGADSYYASTAECETLCAYAETDDGNPSAKCRGDVLSAYTPANGEEVCRDAGPDSETCGTAFIVTCERYCDEFQDTCSHGGDGFESRSKCMTWCEDMPLTAQSAGDDSIECRLDQLAMPILAPPCVGAAPKSDLCG
ncbi:MAG: hypothetical protein AAGA54_04045 [Myxococcota bacterium]